MLILNRKFKLTKAAVISEFLYTAVTNIRKKVDKSPVKFIFTSIHTAPGPMHHSMKVYKGYGGKMPHIQHPSTG